MQAFEKRIGYTFKDKKLLKTALTHTSYANEVKKDGINSYERLEFLGDAVLSLIISEYLYYNYPDLPEGELTKIRASIVCEQSLCQRANELDLGKFIYLGKGEEMTGGRERSSILADVFEAVLAAIYLDSGKDVAREWVLSQLENNIKGAVGGSLFRDYKTQLQELLQSINKEKIEYLLIDERGPDHKKVFNVCIKNGDVVLGTGSGKSKKEAEQNAAKAALSKISKEVSLNDK